MVKSGDRIRAAVSVLEAEDGVMNLLKIGGVKYEKKTTQGNVIEFEVLGEPVAQGRPRATTVNGSARMYDPGKSRDFKNYVKLVAQEHAPNELWTGPLSLEIIIYRKMPKSFSKKKQLEAENGTLKPTTKPDGDNYLKGISDSLNGVIWKDDSQITDAIVRKRYSNRPRVEIKVKEV